MNARAVVVQVMLTFAGLLLTVVAQGQAPAGSTGECKDGTYSSASSKSGACAGHGGVKDWYETKKAAGAESKTPAAPSKSAATPTETPTTAAAGGGVGKVWVNTQRSAAPVPAQRHGHLRPLSVQAQCTGQKPE